MTAPDAAPLARRIYERSHLTGEFRLRSGATSTEYFDKYLFESDPRLMREIAQVLVRLLPDRVDAVAGLELGGVPLATVGDRRSRCLRSAPRRAPEASRSSCVWALKLSAAPHHTFRDLAALIAAWLATA